MGTDHSKRMPISTTILMGSSITRAIRASYFGILWISIFLLIYSELLDKKITYPASVHLSCTAHTWDLEVAQFKKMILVFLPSSKAMCHRKGVSHTFVAVTLVG